MSDTTITSVKITLVLARGRKRRGILFRRSIATLLGGNELYRLGLGVVSVLESIYVRAVAVLSYFMANK